MIPQLSEAQRAVRADHGKEKKETFDETRPLARRAVWPDAARTGDQGEGVSMGIARVGDRNDRGS